VIKARGSLDGRDMVLLGLTHENVARLFADEPLHVATSAPGPDGLGLTGGPDIVIVVGADEDAILEAMRAAGVAPERVHDGRGAS